MNQHIFWCELTEQPYNEIEMHLCTQLSKERQEKINRYRFDIDKRLALYSGLLVRMGIQTFWNIPCKEQAFAWNTTKKPYFMCEDQNIHFNLSHTRNAIVCAYSNQPIGVDIERVKLPFHKEILRYYSAEEQLQCQQGAEREQAISFYTIWTRKEACVKCDGTGLTVELADIPTDLPQLETWNMGEYLISVCTKEKEAIEVTKISEKEILGYFESMTLRHLKK